jgi:hypothetical protein
MAEKATIMQQQRGWIDESSDSDNSSDSGNSSDSSSSSDSSESSDSSDSDCAVEFTREAVIDIPDDKYKTVKQFNDNVEWKLHKRRRQVSRALVQQQVQLQLQQQLQQWVGAYHHVLQLVGQPAEQQAKREEECIE